MVIIFIAIAVGILVAIILFFKIFKSSPGEYVSLTCKKCGLKTNGLKCPVCERDKSFGR